MVTLDTVALIVGILGLLSGFVAFLTFVSSRPTRTEVNAMVNGLKEDVTYIRSRVDELVTKRLKK